ncbi:MAG: discoidin domain-containing protein, partial [Planctomycetes bacterium]|nr:discoidin domain-containing protein [Planctomycetota bacterium]
MSKKLIYLTSFVLVLGLALTSIVEAADPSLVGWWKFDETSGNIAYDSSGNGNDGTFVGNPQWVPGKVGGALEFDGDDYLDCGNGPSLEIRDQITIAFWFQVQAFQNSWEAFFSKGDSAYRASRGGGSGDGTHLGISGTGAGGGNGWFNGPTIITGGDWHHFAGTYDGTEGRIYVDGVLDASTPASGQINIEPENLWIGNNSQNTDRQLHGLMDDVRLYNRALTQEEIQEVMIGIPPGSASNPGPANEATDVPRDVTLSWAPGEFAAPTNGHKVYLGQSFNDVNDATGGVAQDANSYTPAQRLDFDTTYYWRIDEVNAPPTSQIEFKGEVWQFTTEPIAYAIENITATASSAHQADTGPENTINGSGLDANDLHSIEPADMWLSGDEPNGAWIEYEFDKVHKLHEMRVWNHNGMLESVLGFGFKDVTIEYSTNGTDYTTLGTTHEFARAPGAIDYAHNTTIDFSSAAAKYVRLTTNSNWGAGLLDQYGLSEVRFFDIPVHAKEPDPDSGATDVAVDVTLGFRAGREAVTHDVYLSTDEQAVIDGNVPVTTVTETSYGPLSLDLGTTYYWKINEVNEADTTTTWQGDIWNFSTQEFLVVDDFEGYNDYPPDEIWSTWVDGYGV